MEITETAKWDTAIAICRHVTANPFILERDLLAAGFTSAEILRTTYRTNLVRNQRAHGRTFYTLSANGNALEATQDI
jgi:hypothetical protein